MSDIGKMFDLATVEVDFGLKQEIFECECLCVF